MFHEQRVARLTKMVTAHVYNKNAAAAAMDPTSSWLIRPPMAESGGMVLSPGPPPTGAEVGEFGNLVGGGGGNTKSSSSVSLVETSYGNEGI